MKTIRNISAFILSALFLASSSGIIIFYAHCVCSGEKQVSVFVMTDPYEVNFDIHHTEDQGCGAVCTIGNDCNQPPLADAGNCGCSTPDVRYLKLESQVVNEKVRTEKWLLARAQLLLADVGILFSFNPEPEKPIIDFTNPPARFVISSVDFLIQIHRLKIPAQA